MKYNTIVSVLLATLAVTSNAAVPLRWTVETSRVQPAVFDAVRGETLDLEATFNTYGKPLELAFNGASIYWQTNGMGSAWWTEAATVSSNRILATFTPSMDPGANSVVGFLGSPGSNYRAAFTLRFRHGPGATPNAIANPVPVLDLANTTVINAPWPTDETIKSVVRDVVAETGVSGGVDTNAVRDIAAEVVAPVASAVDGKLSKSGDTMTGGSLTIDNGAKNGLRVAASPDTRYEVSVSIHPKGFEIIDNDIGDGKPRRIFFRGDEISEFEKMAYLSDITDAVEPVKDDVQSAYAWSQNIYRYMTANTNAWFAGTNYVTNAEQAAQRHKFAFEDGMDLATVPCSMALWEIRDGVRQCVWDQRDWTAWYWSFKAQQMQAEINASNALFRAEVNAAINSDEAHAWAKRYASTGRRNPDASTTFIDTPSVTLSPGMSWETVATVGGCGYWTIVGNGAVIGGSGTNATLNIKDFEGNSILEITKGQHMMAWLDSSDIVGQLTDADGWVCFDMMADVKPTGYFSTTLVAADFVAETDENCPAQYRWEDLGGHVWRVHFLLKPGIVSGACFAKFQVEVEGKTQIRYNADTVINGGLIFEGVKIAPVIQSGAAVGSTVTWKVVK